MDQTLKLGGKSFIFHYYMFFLNPVNQIKFFRDIDHRYISVNINPIPFRQIPTKPFTL